MDGLRDVEIDGYDVETVGRVSDDLVCVICIKLMRNPVEMECGHGLCAGCLNGFVNSCREREVNVLCPQCREAVIADNVRENKTVRRIILSLMVRCSLQWKGCKWTGEVGNLEDHLAKSCMFELTKCENDGCDEEIMRKSLKRHQSTCEFRLRDCSHCGITNRYNELESHLGLCEMFPLPCPRECGEIIKRNEISVHLNECLLEIIKCPYYDAGCNTKVQRKVMKDHLKRSTEEHMLLVYLNLKPRNDMLYERCLTKDAEINVLKDEVATLKKELAVSKKEVADLKTKSDFQRKLVHYQVHKCQIFLGKLHPNWQLNESFSVSVQELPHELLSDVYLLNQHHVPDKPSGFWRFDLPLLKNNGIYILEKSIEELLDEGYIKEEHYYIAYQSVFKSPLNNLT